MDASLRINIINALLDGLLFLEKILNHLTADLKLERDDLSQSFNNLLIFLDQQKQLYVNSDPQTDKSCPISDIENTIRKEDTEDVTKKGNKRGEESYAYAYNSLEENKNLFEMPSQIGQDHYIRLCVSIDNQREMFYYCVLEKSCVLLGLKLNDSSPNYVIPLEKYQVSKGEGLTIDLKNEEFDIVMRFDSVNDRDSWLTSIEYAQCSVYSYIPNNLQEKSPEKFNSFDIPASANLGLQSLKIPYNTRNYSKTADFGRSKIAYENASENDTTDVFYMNMLGGLEHSKNRYRHKSTDCVFVDPLSFNNFEDLKQKFANSLDNIINDTKSNSDSTENLSGNVKASPESNIYYYIKPESGADLYTPKSLLCNFKTVENGFLAAYKLKMFVKGKTVVYLNFN